MRQLSGSTFEPSRGRPPRLHIGSVFRIVAHAMNPARAAQSKATFEAYERLSALDPALGRIHGLTAQDVETKLRALSVEHGTDVAQVAEFLSQRGFGTFSRG